MFAGDAYGNGSIHYDGAGNRTLMGRYDTNYPSYTGGVITNTWDAKDRLLSDASNFLYGRSPTWAYDGAGNPTTLRGVSGQTYDAQNQKTTNGYNGDGAPTLYGGKTLRYDVEERLTWWGTTSTPTLQMGYRADGLRAWKQVGTGSKTYFLYDGSTLLCEVNASGSVTATDTFGANGLVSRRVGSTTTYYSFDPSGNVTDTSTGGIITTVDTDAYGKGAFGSSVPYGYGGQWGYYTDSQTGLILCGLRYYDPAQARWLTRDPIGYAGGMNLYGYVGGNPTGRVDPSGLMWEIDIRADAGDHAWIVVRDYTTGVSYTYGRWGFGKYKAGIYVNREIGRSFDAERRILMNDKPYIPSNDHTYGLYNNNCTSFAENVWRYNTGEVLKKSIWGIGWDDPTTLVNSIWAANKKLPRLHPRRSSSGTGRGSSDRSSRKSSSSSDSLIIWFLNK